MELRQLKYFLAVADARSFVSAANKLYVSRQAVSKSISQLESELQVDLFMRDTSGAYLTPAGVMFYERVRSSVMELDQLQEEIRQYGTQFRQVIRVAFSIGTLQLFEQRVQRFIHSQDHIVVKYTECTPAECEGLLREHRTDLVITSRTVTDYAFDTKSILSSPYGLLLRDQEEMSGLEKLEPSDLQWLPIGCFADGQTETLCEQLGLKPQYTGIDLIRLFSTAANGLCATILPECLRPPLLHGVRWVPLDIPYQWNIQRVYLRSAENNTLFHSAIDEFLDQVFGQAEE